MIRSNLATRPFYNEQAVRTWLMAAGALIALATIFNVTHIAKYLRDDSAAATQATADTERATQTRNEAARLRATVDARQVELISSEARAANELIERRTFSWTELLNHFERTLPDHVRITSVRPEVVENQSIRLMIAVVARGVDDVNQFMENLETTEAFADLLTREEHMNDEGQLEATLEAAYVPARRATTQAPGASR